MKISRSTRLQAIAVVFPSLRPASLLTLSLSLPPTHSGLARALSLFVSPLLISFSLFPPFVHQRLVRCVRLSSRDHSTRPSQPERRPSSRFLSSRLFAKEQEGRREKERKMREHFSHAENDFSRGTSACPASDKFSTPIIDITIIIRRARIINFIVTTTDKCLVD